MRHVTYGLRRPTWWGFAGRVVEDNETLINKYIDWKSSYTTAAGKNYRIWTERFQNFTSKAPEALTPDDWSAYALSLRGCYSPKCVEYALTVAHNYLRFWHEQGRLRMALYFAQVKKARCESHAAATGDEYRLMLKSLKGCNKLRDRAILMLLHDTGMRVGELVALEIDQMEEDASATIRTEKNVTNRRVFWNQDTHAVLERYIVQRINGKDASDWLFSGSHGSGNGSKPLTTRSVERMIKTACKRAGIGRKLSPHSFRHAWVHRLAALGLTDSTIAGLLGHSTPTTVAGYTKLSRPEAENLARRQFAPTGGVRLIRRNGFSRKSRTQTLAA